MISLIEHGLDTPAALADRFRVDSTEKLQDLYRVVREMDHGDVLDPWAEIAAAVARELRVRIAADWLHAVWCPVFVCPAPVEHLAGVAGAAREVVDAFEAGGELAEAVYRAMAPAGPMPVLRGTAPLSKDAAFLRLIADLVTVVPAEVTA